MRSKVAGRLAGHAVLALALGGAAGCTSLPQRSKNPLHFVGLYLLDRAQDMMEVADLGVTLTGEPGGAFYMSFASLTPFGVGRVNGRFIGLGGGQFLGLGGGSLGSTRFYFAGTGVMVWGYEELGWQEFDLNNVASLHCQDVGLPGVFFPPHGRPGPVPS